MQKMVDKLYKRRKLDKLRPVSQYEYKQREIRTRLDIADIYNRMLTIYEVLEKNGIELDTESTDEQVLVNMVEEDLLSTEIDFEQKKYQERMEAYEEGSIIEYIRRLFTGEPVVPLFDIEDDETDTSTKVFEQRKKERQAKTETETERKNTEEERILDLLKSVEKKGGVQRATKEEHEELKFVLEEIKDVVGKKEQTSVLEDALAPES